MSPPQRVFISHSYQDAEARDRLLEHLPPGFEPVVFPPLEVSPRQLISTELIEALLDCDGLIYLQGGASARSFWVAFERDFALRAGKAVYAADVGSMRITPHTGEPLDLAAFASYHREDAPRVLQVVDYLKRERSFDLWFDAGDLEAGTRFEQAMEQSLRDRLARGGYAVIFWSNPARRSEWVRRELQLASEGIEDFNDRILFALLDPTSIPSPWDRFEEVAVQIYGDSERSAHQRMDDLMVRLYWLIDRNAKSRQNHSRPQPPGVG